LAARPGGPSPDKMKAGNPAKCSAWVLVVWRVHLAQYFRKQIASSFQPFMSGIASAQLGQVA
jgi:hypothetical protein